MNRRLGGQKFGNELELLEKTVDFIVISAYAIFLCTVSVLYVKMNKIQKELTQLYISDAHKCARQMVRESLAEILAATYQTPSPEQVISILTRDFDHSFNEFMARRAIMKSHPQWSDDQIENEIEMQRMRFEDELWVNLRVAALNTIEEIEKLISSLNAAIKKWKIENL